ncbi:unnamed protein product [Prunus armeniaca]|uniref:Uncharacterized protein n=1 Tax=Prunus armeniaca TaxID=36596 RepID=A0A6J5XTQ8_PRUAR|nr:unnamed protein product [Prunus armeniaca]
MTPAAVKWSLQEFSAKLHHLKNNHIKDDAAEEVNEEHGDAAEEENEDEEDAEVNGEHDDAAEHQVQQHHQLQEDLQNEIPEYRNSTLFEEIVRSVPEYKEDEIQLTKEYMMAINNAAEYWTKKV